MVFSSRLAVLAIVLMIPVVIWPHWMMLTWCIGILALVLGVDVLAAPNPQRIGIRRVVDDNTRQGETATSQLILRNFSTRRIRGSVRDGWQPSAGAHQVQQQVLIGPGEAQAVRIDLRPTRRGTLRSYWVTVRTWGPLGMVGRQHTHRQESAQASLTVLPPFHSRRHLPSRLAQLREMDGRSAVQIKGAGHEFDSLREYVRGDDVRSIDWRATARAQQFTVRTWRPERDRRVIIVLDSSRTQAVRVGNETRFDVSLEAALLTAALADAGGDRVEVIAMDLSVRARISSTHQGALLHHIVSGLADVQPRLIAADWSILPVEVARTARQRSLIVILTALDTAALEQGLLPVLPLLAQKHQVLLASVDDPQLRDMATTRDDIATTFLAASAEKDHEHATHLVRILQHLGAEVVQASPDALPPAVADAYLRLKAAGKL